MTEQENEKLASPGVHEHIRPDGSVYTHTHEHDATMGHPHTHSHEHTKAVLNRLSRDCSEVLIQLAAVRSALGSTGKVIMEDHINHCIIDAVESGDMHAVEELNKAISYFIK